VGWVEPPCRDISDELCFNGLNPSLPPSCLSNDREMILKEGDKQFSFFHRGRMRFGIHIFVFGNNQK
jgi:hypothetical protein